MWHLFEGYQIFDYGATILKIEHLFNNDVFKCAVWFFLFLKIKSSPAGLTVRQWWDHHWCHVVSSSSYLPPTFYWRCPSKLSMAKVCRWVIQFCFWYLPHKVVLYALSTFLIRRGGWVVKAVDILSIVLCTHGFESHPRQSFFINYKGVTVPYQNPENELAKYNFCNRLLTITKRLLNCL